MLFIYALKAEHLLPERSKQNRIVLLVLQASIMKNVISTMIEILLFYFFIVKTE